MSRLHIRPAGWTRTPSVKCPNCDGPLAVAATNPRIFTCAPCAACTHEQMDPMWELYDDENGVAQVSRVHVCRQCGMESKDV